jgi:hypothetical protein
MALNVKTFTNSDLNGSYQLVYTHNLNTENVAPTLYDDNGIQLITSDNFWLGDNTPEKNNKANIVTLQYTGPIIGTHKLLLTYQSAGETVSGRRLFGLPEDTPTDDFRIALGKDATPSINMTLMNFFALLLTKLGFLKTSSNLGDLTDSASARTNLGVYSTSQVDAALNPKATLYQSGSGAVLGVANSIIFNPTSNYHPATKKYTDDTVLFYGKITSTSQATQVVTKLSGTLTVTCSHLPEAGQFQITHNKGDRLYAVVGTTMGPSYANVSSIWDDGNTGFKISIGLLNTGVNVDFYLLILRIA